MVNRKFQPFVYTVKHQQQGEEVTVATSAVVVNSG